MRAKRSSVWFSLSLILIAILSLVSCQISTPPSAEVTGDVSFNFDLSGARAAGYNITRVHVKLTHQDAGIVKEQDLTVDNDNNKAYGTISGLRIGTWDVLAELYENDTEVGSGTSQVTIEAGRTADVHIRINLDTGSANVVVEWGNEATELKLVDAIANTEFYYDGRYFYARYAIDDDLGTWWAGDDSVWPMILTVTLDEIHELSTITIYQHDSKITSGSIEYLDPDNNEWKLLSNDIPYGEIINIHANSIRTQKIRVVVNDVEYPATWYNKSPCISEIKIYGY